MLLTLVLIVWGILGYKVVNTIGPSTEEGIVVAATERFIPKPTKKKDTFSIFANYRDPFLGSIRTKAVIKQTKVVQPKKEKLPEKNIVYSGFVEESTSGNKIFFISIDGQQHMMSKNDVQQEVKLLSGNQDKVTLRYNGQTRIITLGK